MTGAVPHVLADDEPIPLRDAPALFWPHGGMSVAKLRKQAAEGKLVIERIGRTEFVTREAIRQMRAACQEQGSRPASKSEPKPESVSGSSETDRLIAERDALLTRLETPNSRFANTSHTKARGRTPANVTLLRSG